MLRSEENKIKNHLEGGAGKVLTEFGWGEAVHFAGLGRGDSNLTQR